MFSFKNAGCRKLLRCGILCSLRIILMHTTDYRMLKTLGKAINLYNIVCLFDEGKWVRVCHKKSTTCGCKFGSFLRSLLKKQLWDLNSTYYRTCIWAKIELLDKLSLLPYRWANFILLWVTTIGLYECYRGNRACHCICNNIEENESFMLSADLKLVLRWSLSRFVKIVTKT